MKLLNFIVSGHNWLADKDFLWWPFSFLRPSAKEVMTFKHTLLMTACFGGLTFVMFVFFAIANNAMTADAMISTFFFCFFGFLIWFNGVTKPFWNVRANQLKK